MVTKEMMDGWCKGAETLDIKVIAWIPGQSIPSEVAQKTYIINPKKNPIPLDHNRNDMIIRQNVDLNRVISEDFNPIIAPKLEKTASQQSNLNATPDSEGGDFFEF